MYFRSDYIVILPGGIGTLAEFTCAIEEYRASLGNKKIIIVNYEGFYDDIINWMKKNVETEFISETLFDCFYIANSVEEVEKIVEDNLSKEK